MIPILKIGKLRHREVKVTQPVHGGSGLWIQAVGLLVHDLSFLSREGPGRTHIGGEGWEEYVAVEKKSEYSRASFSSKYKEASFHLSRLCVTGKLVPL